MISWVEHTPGKQTVLLDALSRNEHFSNDLVQNCSNMTSMKESMQLAADLCRKIVINE